MSTMISIFVINVFAIPICIIIRKYLLSFILTAINVLIFLWIFTPIPVHIGLIKLPVIEFVKIRAPTDSDYINNSAYEKSGVIEFLSDKDFDKFDMRKKKYLLRLIGAHKSNYTYQDMYKDMGFVTVIESNSIYLKKQINDRFLYEAVFNIEIPTSEIKDSIYCKVFFVQMFSPIIGTDEICIPRDSLLLVTKEDDYVEK